MMLELVMDMEVDKVADEVADMEVDMEVDWHGVKQKEMTWNKKKWRETKRNDEKQKEVTWSDISWRFACGDVFSPHCTASAKSSNYNVCIYDHRIDHIISSASQSSSSFIQWFLFRNKSILTGAFLMNVRSYTPAYWSWRWCDTVWTLISDLLCFHWFLSSW